MRSTDTLSFHTRFQALRRQWPELGRFADPAALLDHLHRPGGDAAGRNAVLRSLVAAAQAEPSDAPVTLMLLALWPGLDAAHRRLSRHFRTRPDELVAQISERITRGVRSLDLDGVSWVAATLIRNAERDIRRALRAQWAEAALRGDRPDGPPVPVGPPSRLGLPDGLDADAMAFRLAAQLRDWVGPDADLVVAVAVLGEQQNEAAARLGIGPEAARKRYQRAIRRVRLRLKEIP